MECTPVVPDSYIADTRRIVDRPLEPHLEVVVVGHNLDEVVEQHIRLVSRHSEDSGCELLVDEQAFPSSHRVCERQRRAYRQGETLLTDSDHGVDRLKLVPFVQRAASLASSHVEPESSRSLLEPVGVVNGVQSFEQLSDWRRDPGVCLVR